MFFRHGVTHKQGGEYFVTGSLEQVFTVMTDFCSFLKNISAADVLTTQLLFGIGSINPTGIWTLCCSSGGGEGLSKRLPLQASQLLSVFVATRPADAGGTDLWSSELEECVCLRVCVQRVEIILTRSRDQGQAEIREAKGKWRFIFSLLVKVLLQALCGASDSDSLLVLTSLQIVREGKSMYIKQISMS